MSPSVYSSLGYRFVSKKLNLWIISSACMLTTFITVMLSEQIDEVIPYQIPFGIALFLVALAWGILVSVYWYGPEGKFDQEKINSYSGVKRKLNKLMSWYGSIVLSIWFLSVFTVLPWFLLNQVQ